MHSASGEFVGEGKGAEDRVCLIFSPGLGPRVQEGPREGWGRREGKGRGGRGSGEEKGLGRRDREETEC